MNYYSRERDNEYAFASDNEWQSSKRGSKYNLKWVSDDMVYRECQE